MSELPEFQEKYLAKNYPKLELENISLKNQLKKANEDYQKTLDIVVALCEYSRKCTLCYRNSKGSNCVGCDNYYLDCDCTPLTKMEIEEGILQ